MKKYLLTVLALLLVLSTSVYAQKVEVAIDEFSSRNITRLNRLP